MGQNNLLNSLLLGLFISLQLNKSLLNDSFVETLKDRQCELTIHLVLGAKE